MSENDSSEPFSESENTDGSYSEPSDNPDEMRFHFLEEIMDDEFYEMMDDIIDVDDMEEGSGDENLFFDGSGLSNLIRGYLMRAQFNDSDDSDDSDDSEEAPLDPNIQNPFPDPFGYLTNIIHHNPTDSFRDVSNNKTVNLPEFGVHRCCIIPLHEVIPFPKEQIPFVTSNPSMVVLLLQLLGIHASTPESQLVPCVIGSHITNEGEMELMCGCTVTVEKAYFNETLFSIGIVLSCQRRCQVQSFSRSHSGVLTGTIEILEDSNQSLPSYKTPSTINSFDLYPILGKRILFPQELQLSEQEIQECCIRILTSSNDRYASMSDVEILREVSSDTLELSYFLCEQLLLNYSEEMSLFNCSTPEERIRMANEFCRVWDTTVIRCVCGRKLHRFHSYQRLNLFGGNTSKSVFVNRYGNSFRVITTRTLMNYTEISPPSSEDTWFPGYQWQILECAYCGNHIGWKFIEERNEEDNNDSELAVFFAISQSSIVFADHLIVCMKHEKSGRRSQLSKILLKTQ